MGIPRVKELWMLWNVKTNDWAIACDDPTPHVAYLCAKDFKAAEALQKHQREVYQVKSVPIRII